MSCASEDGNGGARAFAPRRTSGGPFRVPPDVPELTPAELKAAEEYWVPGREADPWEDDLVLYGGLGYPAQPGAVPATRLPAPLTTTGSLAAGRSSALWCGMMGTQAAIGALPAEERGRAERGRDRAGLPSPARSRAGRPPPTEDAAVPTPKAIRAVPVSRAPASPAADQHAEGRASMHAWMRQWGQRYERESQMWAGMAVPCVLGAALTVKWWCFAAPLAPKEAGRLAGTTGGILLTLGTSFLAQAAVRLHRRGEGMPAPSLLYEWFAGAALAAAGAWLAFA